MQVEVHDNDGIIVVDLAGDIDGKTAPDLQDKLFGVMKPLGRIVVNMEHVAFMSSAGLRAVLLIYREAKSKEAHVVLAGVNKDIRSSMSATGFLAFFVVCDSVPDAIAKLG